MGNLDRHSGNMFIGKKKDGTPEMIGIDHGFSFPNDNHKYISKDMRNQERMHDMIDYDRTSNQFKNNFRD